MMRKIHKKLMALLLCTMSVVSIFGCGLKKESSGKDIVICLDWTPNTNHTGLYVALEKGYYEDAGLNVTIVQPPEGGATLMCASGQAQFAIDAQDTMAAALDREEPLEITAVATILQHNTSGILSRKGDGITSPKGLEGKTYSTWDSPIELAIIKYCMEKEGADFSKLDLIPNNITNEPMALGNKQTDAVWIYYGWSGINAELSDVECDYFAFKDIAEELDYYTPVLIANSQYLSEYENEAMAFMEATVKGYEYAAANPKESADILLKSDDTGALNGAKDLVYSSQEWMSKEYLDENGKWGIIDSNRWNTFYTWLYENQLTTKDLTGKGFNNEWIKTSN
jgi:ABC-type nitrate/sulfonate/bicarbonate transport system substrate-binding protein